MKNKCKIFPDFRIKKFTVDLRSEYLNYYKNFEPYSDYSFSNLMVWLDLNNDLEIANDAENIIFKFSNPFQGNSLNLTLLGRNNPIASINKILEYEKKLGIKQEIVMVPESVISGQSIDNNKLKITEDLDNRDYIFSIEETYYSKGEKYDDYRHKINNFLSNHHTDLNYKDLDIRDFSSKKLIINSMHLWGSPDRITNNDKSNIEGLAIDRYLKISDKACHCIGIFIGGKLESFSLFQLPPQKDFAIGNHIKCNYAYKYIFDFTYCCTINKLFSQNIKYINGEQDLGIPGLRIHKREMNPVGYLKRYTITVS